ncbi:MAG: hypothetical protein FP816_03920 [Desulfobacteraceae bacterium]|nr:hypothetical protein [Desulfobacteraceae bacterium]
MMKEVTRRTVTDPGNKKRKTKDIADSSWTYRFPRENHPFPARVILHKKAKTFRIEINAVGPEIPELIGHTTLSMDGKSRSIDSPIASTIGMALSMIAQTAAIPQGDSDKRLTGKFDPEKPFAVSGMAVYNASEIPSFKMMLDGMAQSLGPGAVANGDGKLHVSYTLAWNCEPSDIEAVIVPKADYESWLPAASKSGSDPGNAILFEVKLIDKKTGKEPKDYTAYFQCDLSDVSKEPGTCMNSPSKGTEPDLKILPTDNPDMETVSSDGQSATSKKKLKKCALSVSSFDGAAYGRMKIVAHLNDGRAVLAHLEGKSEGMNITLPFDEDENHIADAWEDAKGVKGKAPSVDDDTEPFRDRNNGDGLTIWEEYRGFLEDGTHFRTDPRKKDLFICDQIGGRSKKGINRFAALTKLDVHHKLTVDELDYTRIINRNRSKGAPHVVDQHGLLIEKFDRKDEDYIGWTVGGPGTPKSIDRIVLAHNIPDTVTRTISKGTTKTYDYYSPTAAHELLHACNVWHHGERDTIVYWKVKEVDGKKKLFEYENEADCSKPEKGYLMWVYTEAQERILPEHSLWATPQPIYRGKDQGQHSGDEDCVMRYDCSESYYGYTTHFWLSLQDEEPVGQGLCVGSSGTGVNKAGRKPYSRYGDADAGKGACADQICVNDLYH